MAETYQRNHSDRTTYGYRQLAGAGSVEPELKTMVFAGVGAALGILFGTLLAGSALRGTTPTPSLHAVQAGSIAPAPMTPPVAKSVQTSSVEHPAAQPESQRTSVAQNSAPAKTSAAHTLIVSQEIGSGHKLTTTKKRHSTRHWRHFRHRLHNSLMASIPVPAPAVLEMPVAEHIEKPFVFTVEGDVSLASFDTMTKTVDTYEGETFALNQAPSGSTDIAWQDNVPNIHYRCDQSGNCDLVRAGQAFLNSRRTK